MKPDPNNDVPRPDLRGAVVLQVLPALGVGGAERGCVDVAAALVRAGGTALVVSRGGSLVPELEAAGARHITLPAASKNPLVMARNIGRLRAILRAEGVGLVHARSRAPAWSAWAAARLDRLPFLTTFHAAYNFRSRVKWFYNSVMAKGDHIIAISRYLETHVRSQYAVPPERITVVPRGIDLARFDPERVEPSRVDSLRQRYGLPAGRALVVMPGRLSRLKGQVEVVRALALLERADLHVLLVGPDGGDGSFRQEVRRLAESLGVAARLTLAEACSDMPAVYALADLVLVASNEPEGFGRVAAEAQAMGKPVVVTRIGALPELVLEGETGFIVPPGDPAGLAAGIARALAQDPESRARMGAAGQARARALYSVDAMTGTTLEVYAALLGRAGPRSDRPVSPPSGPPAPLVVSGGARGRA